ncbi:hypothetical protein M0R19_02510 [Candidatus Pacearchaeota archaeon]|nr:hypothetical protein [Candidatus Pacearchaeota archaeon]
MSLYGYSSTPRRKNEGWKDTINNWYERVTRKKVERDRDDFFGKDYWKVIIDRWYDKAIAEWRSRRDVSVKLKK